MLTFCAGIAQAGGFTLDEAEALARQNNEAPGLAAARIARAQSLTREAWASMIPSLTFSTTYTRRISDVTRTVGEQTVVVQQANSIGGNLTLDWPLFDARAFALIDAANSGERATGQEAEELKRSLAFSVAQAFFLVLAEDALLDAAAKRTEAAAATLSEAKARQAAGLAAKNEVTRAELELATARLEESNGNTAAIRARSALSELIGAPLPSGRGFVEPPPSKVPPLVADELLARARTNRQDLLALTARADQAESLAKEPLLRLVPTLGVRGVLFASNEPGLSGRTVDGNAALVLTWRIFDGGLRYEDRVQRRADVEEARLSIRAAERHVVREVLDALTSLSAAKAAEELAIVRLEVAHQNADEVHVLYGNGLASALEQVDALVSAYDAAAGLSRQKVAVRIAELDVLRALGSWPTETDQETK